MLILLGQERPGEGSTDAPAAIRGGPEARPRVADVRIAVRVTIERVSQGKEKRLHV
jgi:hypothetical protein